MFIFFNMGKRSGVWFNEVLVFLSIFFMNRIILGCFLVIVVVFLVVFLVIVKMVFLIGFIIVL